MLTKAKLLPICNDVAQIPCASILDLLVAALLRHYKWVKFEV